MDLPNFHDGHFDGIRLEPEKVATIFLRSVTNDPYIVVLKGVETLSLGEIKAGNIILDLVTRRAREATLVDMRVLYGVDEKSEQASKLLDNLREKELLILEVNPSYGAEGLFLFKSYEIREASGAISSS